MGDLNGHHQEWLGSTNTNRHELSAFDFTTVSGYDQFVVGPTYAHGGTLDIIYQPIDRKKRKGKRVEDYSRDRAA